MARTSRLNDAQLKLIQMFEFVSTPQEENELMDVLKDYYVRKLEEARKRVMNTGKYSDEAIDAYVQTHQHGKLIKQ